MATDVLDTPAANETPEVEDKDGTEPVDSDEPDNGMPLQPKPLGVMVAYLPSDVELDEIQVPGGLDGNDLHCTLRYYGEVTDENFLEAIHEAARDIAGNVPPFVASVTGRRQLGDNTPPADTLILADHKAFRLALAHLPPSDKDYPAFTPHITVGYGIGDDALAQSTPDNDVVFDHIVVGNGNDDWTVYMLGDIPPEALDGVDPDAYDDVLGEVTDDTMPDNENENGVTAGLDDAIEGKIGVGSKRGKSLDPRPSGSKQKCFHGSPATCKSVRWIAVYTALREKRGFSKSKAAAIANAMHSKWKRGQPNRPGQRPMIRKTI